MLFLGIVFLIVYVLIFYVHLIAYIATIEWFERIKNFWLRNTARIIIGPIFISTYAAMMFVPAMVNNVFEIVGTNKEYGFQLLMFGGLGGGTYAIFLIVIQEKRKKVDRSKLGLPLI